MSNYHNDSSGISRITGCLLGTAAGDAIGLPFEGMSPRRIAKFGIPPLRHRLLFGNGMISDDSEHACMVAQCLISSGKNPQRFASHLAWRMRWWVAALPAGIGLGTLRAMIKLWLGFNANHSGVFTAGNGPMMRSGIIGVACADDINRMQELVTISTRITHTDPRADRAAFIIAWAASLASQSKPITAEQLTEVLPGLIEFDEELETLIREAVDSAQRNETAMAFCQRTGMHKGVSGYCYTTLKVVLQVCLRYPDDFQQAMTEIVQCGGDTDTVAAIAGSIIGAGVATEGIPADWIGHIREWPRSIDWITRLANQLAEHQQQVTRPVSVFYPFALVRNLLFMLLVLAHGFRRLLPPY